MSVRDELKQILVLRAEQNLDLEWTEDQLIELFEKWALEMIGEDDQLTNEDSWGEDHRRVRNQTRKEIRDRIKSETYLAKSEGEK